MDEVHHSRLFLSIELINSECLLVKKSSSLSIILLESIPNIRKLDREPRSIQDQMAWEEALKNNVDRIMANKIMNNAKYKSMKKMEVKIKSKEDKDSVIHYMLGEDGNAIDPKFKKHSTDKR